VKQLSIYAEEHLVGHLNEGDANGMSFIYAPNWLANPDAVPLSPELPLADQVFHGDHVSSFFENLLPEGDVLEFISKAVAYFLWQYL